MILRNLLASIAMAILLLAVPATWSRAQAASASNNTTVVMLLTVHEGQPAAPAVAAMKEIVAFIGKATGLIDQSLLVSSFPNNKPSHVHIMRWNSIKDWEALSSSQEFLDLVSSNTMLFDLKTAEVFTPVE